MSEVPRKSDLRTDVPDYLRPRRSLILWAFLLLLCGLAGSSTASAGGIQNGASGSPGPGLPFAIADFDGDRRPDVANVQAGGNASGNSTYWIQLQLSATGRQSIQLDAPSGGLLIEARDVNGDNAVDLVLTTAWFRQPVAVLLNDGHGKFSRAAPTLFPGAFIGCSTNWLPATILTANILGVPPEPGTGIGAEEAERPHDRSLTRLLPSSSAGFPADRFLISTAVRAPPSEVLYL